MDCSSPGSSVYGILQARVLEWVAISFSRGSSRPRDQTCISCVGRRILYHWATREDPQVMVMGTILQRMKWGSMRFQQMFEASKAELVTQGSRTPSPGLLWIFSATLWSFAPKTLSWTSEWGNENLCLNWCSPGAHMTDVREPNCSSLSGDSPSRLGSPTHTPPPPRSHPDSLCPGQLSIPFVSITRLSASH